MDRITKYILGIMLCGMITLATGSVYIPSVGGNIPQGQTVQEFTARQQDIVYSSPGFKATMAGTGISIISIFLLYIRSRILEYELDKVSRIVPAEPLRSILKPPGKNKLSLQSSITVRPSEPVLTVIRQPIPPRKFKYPPPYDTMNSN